MQRSASIAIVSEGLTPRGLGTMDPSTTNRPSWRLLVFPERIREQLPLEGFSLRCNFLLSSLQRILHLNEEWSQRSGKLFSNFSRIAEDMF